jgi:hypothetical protein
MPSSGMWRRSHLVWTGLQPPAHAGSSLADFSTMKLEAIHSSESSDHTSSTRRHIPEDGILHSHRRENLKYYKDTFNEQTNYRVLRTSTIMQLLGKITVNILSSVGLTIR